MERSLKYELLFVKRHKDMKKFFVLYKAPTEEFQKVVEGANSSPEEAQKGMKEWTDWMTAHSSEIIDNGNPVGKTKEVKRTTIKDIKNEVGGYSIVQADSHEQAAKLFSDNPHFSIPRATIEVMEIVQMPGV